MENKMYCAFRSTPTGWLVMLCSVFKGHLAALANIWHVFFLVYVCVVHTCYYSTPGLLSELASLTMLWGGWLMQHVEPCETTALCPCVSLPGGLQDCRSVPCKPFPCSVSEQTCKQLRFPSEVVSGDGFLSCLPREGEEGEGGWEVRAADKSETCLVHAGTTKSWICADQNLLMGTGNLKKVNLACGRKPIKSVFLTNELWDESLQVTLKEGLFSKKSGVLSWLQVQSCVQFL